MARVVTVTSQKGGVGKTTTVLNLGYTLSKLGDRVLLVDADPQGGMAIASNLRVRTEVGLAQVFRDAATLEDVVIPTRAGKMAVVGCGVQEPRDTFALEAAAQDGRLRAAVERLGAGFDVTLVDAPAGAGSLVAALLAATHGALVVVQCRSLALKTLPVLLKLIRHVRRTTNPQLEIEGALVTMWRPGASDEEELLADLAAGLPDGILFRTVIPHDEIFEQASLRALPMAMLPGGREAARPYLQLALEMKERQLLRQGGGADEPLDGLF